MSHRTEAKWYDIYAVYNNGEQMKTFIIRSTLNEVPPLMVNDDDHSLAMFLEGYRCAAEAIAQVNVEFEFEEVK